MMAIGASCLDKTHGHEITETGALLSNFLAWHLRWEIFADVNFRPPAKLWIFQTLLLLEFYEKMYSTRALHERAHIHHATTLTLMRRGSSLIGRSASDSPPSIRDERTDRGPSSRHSSVSGAHTPDEWWNGFVIQTIIKCKDANLSTDGLPMRLREGQHSQHLSWTQHTQLCSVTQQ